MAWPALFAGLIGFGTGLDIYGQIAGYEQEKEINKARINELVIGQKLNAEAGAEDAYQRRELLRKTLSRNVAMTAASGAMMDGSPIQAQLNAIHDAAYDINIINRNTAVRDWSIRQQIENINFSNKMAKKNMKFGILQSLVGGVGKYAQFRYMQNLYEEQGKINA